MNSYMLPHGQRPTAKPRVATEPICTSAPSTVNATAIRPNRSRHGRPVAVDGASPARGTSVSAAGASAAPAATGTFASAAGTRVFAYSPRCSSIASR